MVTGLAGRTVMGVSRLFSLNGRIGRREFVLTQIAVFVASYFTTFLLIVVGGAGFASMTGVEGVWSTLVNVIAAILAGLGLWISLAAAVKRCHDRALSGWMLLFAMPPVIGQLWLFLSLVLAEGEAGANAYGDPAHAHGLSPAPALA
jgi:uncharacterized membrane protein YhaH (DUF805 family)